MNFIKRFFKKRENRKKYYDEIDKHKTYVIKAFYELIECKDLQWLLLDEQILTPLWLRAAEHDNSKFKKEEFEPYRKHFYPIDEKEKEQSEETFEKAWQHHLKVNDHHWQHRIHWKDEDFDVNTELACLENIIDWLARGYEFHDRPYQYYEAHKDEITLPKKQKAFMEKIIYEGIDKEYVLKERKKHER